MISRYLVFIALDCEQQYLYLFIYIYNYCSYTCTYIYGLINLYICNYYLLSILFSIVNYYIIINMEGNTNSIIAQIYL